MFLFLGLIAAVSAFGTNALLPLLLLQEDNKITNDKGTLALMLMMSQNAQHGGRGMIIFVETDIKNFFEFRFSA